MASIQRALEHYAHDDQARFGIEAGIGAENLAKLVLASIHPSLIVKDAGGFGSLLLASGWSGAKAPNPADFRSVGAVDAFQRATLVHPALSRFGAELRYLAEVRNGLAHIGFADLARIEAVASGFVGACRAMAKVLGIAETELFGQHMDLATKVEATAEESVVRFVAKRMAVASQRIEALRNLDSRALEFLQESADTKVADADDTTMTVDCPVCSSVAIVKGDIEEDPWEYDELDSAGTVISASRRRRFNANEFECDVCGLQLNGWRQMSAAGLDAQSELETESASPVEAQEEEMEELLRQRRIEELIDLEDLRPDEA